MTTGRPSRGRAAGPNQRTLAKARSRQKILDAAKRLFAEKGYEAATIRDIATGAGMSTGAVFASFTGKADVFGQIVLADRTASYDLMAGILREPLAGAARGIDETLAAMFEAAYRFRLDDLPLMQATISASWSPEMGAEVRERWAKRPVADLIAEALRAATFARELAADADVGLLSRMLWESYLGNYTHAAHESWPLERLMGQMRAQIRIVLAGARLGPKD